MDLLSAAVARKQSESEDKARQLIRAEVEVETFRQELLDLRSDVMAAEDEHSKVSGLV